MAALTMKIRGVYIAVEMGLWEDDCGNPCVYIKNHDDEYLSCHEDGKHIFWNEVEDDEAWTWEMWYPEYTDHGVIVKSYHGTYMTADSEEDGRMWQCDEPSDVYVDMTKSQYEKMMNGDYVDTDDTEDTEDTDDTDKENSEESDKEDDEPEPEPKKKVDKKEKPEQKSTEKPKRTIDPEVHKKGAIARKIKSYLESECKDELNGLKGKDKTDKKTELYKKHKSENSKLYKKLYKKAEQEV